MSKSYRVPRFQDNGKGRKSQKRSANRKVRYSDIVQNGSYYKKLYEQWRITDYKGGWYSWRELYNWLSDHANKDNYHLFKSRTFWAEFWVRVSK